MVKRIIISRTDGIGDVVLTLPVAGLLKQLQPEYKILFLGRSYTKPVIDACQYVDEFINWDEILKLPNKKKIEYFKSLQCDIILHVYPERFIAKIAYRSRIRKRIGTSHRIYHWFYCNHLIRLGRFRSNLHEAQLNLKLLRPFGAKNLYNLREIQDLYGFNKIRELDPTLKSLIDPSKFNLILHPKSKGSAREWGLNNFENFINTVPKERFKIFVSGTTEEKDSLRQFIDKFKGEVVDITGQMNLDSFISFINATDGLIASSTGPLHIAAALGKVVVGLYAPRHPIHPGRWSPVGANSSYLVLNKVCNKCQRSATCECIQSIKPFDVMHQLNKTFVNVSQSI